MENIYSNLQDKQNKIDELAVNISHLEQHNDELYEEIKNKENQLNEYDDVNYKLHNENEALLKLIDSNKYQLDSMRTLFKNEEIKYKEAIAGLNKKEEEIKKLDDTIFLKNTEMNKLIDTIDQLKQEKLEAEKKTDDEFCHSPLIKT